MENERDLVDSHLRNMQAELHYNLKVERESELYTKVEIDEESGIVITSSDYSKSNDRFKDLGLPDVSKGFIKKPYVSKKR